MTSPLIDLTLRIRSGEGAGADGSFRLAFLI